MATLADLPAGPLAPAWFVFPFAILTLIVLSAHVAGLSRVQMPPSRKRIRTANGWLMMFTTPLVAFAFGLADPQRPRVFVFVWTLVFALLSIVLLLAMADMMNTWRINRRERRTLRAQLVAARREAAAIEREAPRANRETAPIPRDPRDSTPGQ